MLTKNGSTQKVMETSSSFATLYFQRAFLVFCYSFSAVDGCPTARRRQILLRDQKTPGAEEADF